MITIKEILSAIEAGQLDQSENAINDAFRLRRNARSQDLITTIKEGDSVRLYNLSPKWLNGKTGKITGRYRRSQTRLNVRLDEKPLPPDTQDQYGIPASCLEIIP